VTLHWIEKKQGREQLLSSRAVHVAFATNSLVLGSSILKVLFNLKQ
jgi:hypothetical protein